MSFRDLQVSGIKLTKRFAPQPRNFRRIFVAAAGQADHDRFIFGSLRRQLHAFGNGVRTFQRRQYSFVAAPSRSNAASASSSRQLMYFTRPRIFPIAVLGPDAGIIQAGRDAVHVARLAVFVLHHVAVAAVQHAGRTVRQRRGMIAWLRRSAAGFDADQFDFFVLDERIKHARRVAAAADASHHRDPAIGRAARGIARSFRGR